MSAPDLPRGLELRPCRPEEFDAFHAQLARAFAEPLRAEEREHERALLELDRSLGVFGSDGPVATAAAYSLRMSLPGAEADVAGVTWVSVAPTHRRRGLLTALMTRQLRELHASGEAVAALWASEAGIYGRFGYGVASRRLGVELHRGDGALQAPPPELPTRLRDAADVEDELRRVHAAARPGRPGLLDRDRGPGWRAVLFDPEHRRSGGTALQAVVVEQDGVPAGYALYRAHEGRWTDGLPGLRLDVAEVTATTPAASAAVWHLLLGVDLVAELRCRSLPEDEPLLHLLADPRRARPRLLDGLWVRPVRVGEALAARRYAGPVDVVLDVVDPQLPENTGRWRLRGDVDGGACARTSDPAELALGVADLGAALLGGTTLTQLAAAGRVQERRTGALTAASRAFRSEVAPFCGDVF